ncbi:hypothetical protein HRG_004212 [Hirsutella rhossiliensis]|uniref:Uncharacterized protein n=1 Tax=Hirsutella rhossiliensis TaxID=111463 RepID=A0A9P8SJ25_9HYPO|nr:uncharacterized protein HRG_04212 [Hirsutella rhossiliensis]KAH0963784.1 hypothetical protein HRG_04212 [Hirsutella rhossiliensis]
MNRQRAAMTAAAGAAVIGVGMYSNTKGQKDEPQVQRHNAHVKRDMGLSGAGVGGNAMTGSTDISAAPPSSHKNLERTTRTTAAIEKLPSGGVGGGEGAGGSSARKMQLPTGSGPDNMSRRGKEDDAQVQRRVQGAQDPNSSDDVVRSQ